MSPTMLDIRRVLKWSQIVVNVAVMILSMCVLLPLGYVWKYFNSSCLLNADIFVQVSPNKSVLLNTESTKWGDNSLCFYTTFLPVVVAIHSFIWTWFFVYVRRSLKDGGLVILLILRIDFFNSRFFLQSGNLYYSPMCLTLIYTFTSYFIFVYKMQYTYHTYGRVLCT